MLKHNKSPGLDGLPGEFYQTFWNELKPYFYNSLIQTFYHKCMTFSQRLSSIKREINRIWRTIDLYLHSPCPFSYISFEIDMIFI
jgi:hypothetical protein